MIAANIPMAFYLRILLGLNRDTRLF